MRPLLLVVALFMMNTLLMPLIVEMIKERAPVLAIHLIKLSVRLLPTAHRDRYLAEWTAELEEMDRQNISQLVASIRILLRAPFVGRVLHAKDRHPIINQANGGNLVLIALQLKALLNDTDGTLTVSAGRSVKMYH